MQILNQVREERKIDEEKGNDSVEMRYMMKERERMDEINPNRKRRKLCKEEDDVDMPVLDMNGVLVRESCLANLLVTEI